MSTTRLWALKKWTTIFGSLSLMLPIGLPWYWGNMSLYVRSYIAKYGDTDEGLQTPWIISFYFLFNAVGLFIAGFMSKKAGKRLTLFLGIVLFLGGMFLTYFSMQSSVLMVNLTLGFVAGVGGGIINGMALQYAVSWAGNDLGFVTSFVQSGFNAGPVFINPFVTYLVNSENISPDSYVGPYNLFSERRIIDRVPCLIYSFGLLCLVFHLVGFLIVRECPSKMLEEEVKITNNSNGVAMHVSGEVVLPDTTQSSSNVSESIYDQVADMKPLDMIKTKPFYTLWFSLMMFDNAMLVLANYYKDYGAVWISDDHFLTFLGTVLTLATILAFPFWGYLTDRIGVKTVLITMYALSSIVAIFMYFTPQLSRWAYLVNIAFSGWFVPPTFSIIIVATCKLFGKTYYSSNIGVVASLSLLINFVNPMVFEHIIRAGWFYIFLYSCCLSISGMITIMVTLPNC